MSIPTGQKALLLPSKQGEFVVDTVDVPNPDAGEVLVRIEAASLSHLELLMQRTGIYITSYPAILGLDAAGVVVAVGDEVENVSLGDRVLFVANFNLANRFAAQQQYAVMKANLTSKIPPNITFDEAATLPCNLTTAVNGLYSSVAFVAGGIQRGGANLTPFWKEGGRGKYAAQPIVILGGSSSVAIQLARISGFSPIITTASPKNADFVTSFGATHVLDRNLSREVLIAKIREITSQPVHLVYDAVSFPETQNVAYDILAPGGTLIVVVRPAIDQAKLTVDKSVYVVFGSPHIPEYADFDAEIYRILPELLSSGEIKPNIPEVVPGGLSGIPGGLERLKRNEVSARKLVVHPPETL
ncbi:unnamed protein product [Somion occarium]|uniref:Enoyl reductase (ER) domain-containing protein n=1 Tax=Somion occarium TaxID=3059160 RepID=A0ABP1EDH9_9APHY